MILLPWYVFALACMASFAIAWILLSMLTSGKMDDVEKENAQLRLRLASALDRVEKWQTLAEMYHDGIHKQAGIDNDE